MKITLTPCPRTPAIPWWAAAILACWLAMVGVSEYMSHSSGTPVTLCLLKRTTGMPCPTCGSTRAVMNLLQGHVGQAIACNPMVCLAAVLIAVTLTLRLGFARKVHVELSRVEKRICWALIAAAVLANWAYVIRYVG